MREIKFRAFNNENNEMLYEFDLIGNKDFILAKGFVHLQDYGINDFVEDFILMQSTGLKDKNGEEIYEGDIVKYVAGENYQTIGVVTWIDEKNSVNFKTYPLVCAFVIHNEKENKTDKFEWDETDYMEVIGNIYENSNLLESEEK